jgi:hypothetical protein
MKDINYKIALISLTIIVIFPVLSVFLGVGGGIKIPAVTAFLCITVLLTDNNLQESFFSRYVILWFFLMLYHYVNALTKNVDGTNSDIFIKHVFTTSVAMGLTVYLFMNNPKLTLSLTIIIYFMFLIIALSAILRNGYDPDNRFGAADIIHPNILGQFAGLTCVLISAFVVQKRKSLIYFIFLMTFPVLVALFTESRNALVLVAFAFIIYIVGYSIKEKMNTNTVVFFSVFSILLLILVKFVLNETTSGLRMSSALEGEYMQVQSYYATNTVWDKLLGERIVYYVLGYKNFSENIWTGIGLWNFSDYNHYDYPLHSEYMVHIAEGGLIGSSIYFLFIGNIIISFTKKINFSNYEWWQFALTFISIIIVGITARVFAYVQFFPIYGIIVGYLMSQNNLKNSPSVRVIFARDSM